MLSIYTPASGKARSWPGSWDVIRVPFPYTDRATRQARPALVISNGDIEDAHGLLWVLMITSAENRGWPSDIAIKNLSMAGLPVASVIRTAKLATIEAADASKLGRIPPLLLQKVVLRVTAELRTGRPAN